jgi:protein-disulfide isomerase
VSGRKERERRRDERLQRESEAEAGARRRRLMQIASAATFLAIVVVAVLIVVSQSQTDGGDTSLEGAAAVNRELQGIPQDGLVLGRAGAPVHLVEFGDLQCPVCKAFSEEVLPPVIEARVRSGGATLEFRNYVIIGDESTPAGAAAIAAGRQGRGWNYVDLFYRNQGLERSGYVTDDFLTAIARGAGVPDLKRWNEDRRSKSVLAQVSSSSSEAEGLGFSGTPSFAVEGPRANGLEPLGFMQSPDEFIAAIDRAR